MKINIFMKTHILKNLIYFHSYIQHKTIYNNNYKPLTPSPVRQNKITSSSHGFCIQKNFF